ncbi:hypothetical protein CASFOL_002652 [Castilleja foliolosa]|uniref:NYN domain-containing protein n=1 Tax=Castilleja foliolosa TaxID=1961234 RepID=A0ABD3EF76_9LAMI
MSSKAEAEFSSAKISVWWHMENCPMPSGCDPNAVIKNIRSALAKLSYRGPITINAYGDLYHFPTDVQQAFTRSVISFNSVSAGFEYTINKMVVDMLLWSFDNPAPANCLLISGDSVFSYALHNLDMRNYNILLAHPQHIEPSGALVSAANCVWHWTTLAANGGLPFTHIGEFSDSD